MYFKNITEDYKRKGRKFYPASKEAIDALTEKWGPLPTAYIQFLQTMGGGHGIIDKNNPPEDFGFMEGHEFYIDQLDGLKEAAEALLEENNSPRKLGENDFVFFMSQGVMFAFFNLKEGYDPPVYFFNEDGKGVRKVSDNFSDFIWNLYKYPANVLGDDGADEEAKPEKRKGGSGLKTVLGFIAAALTVGLLIFLIRYSDYIYDFLTR